MKKSSKKGVFLDRLKDAGLELLIGIIALLIGGAIIYLFGGESSLQEIDFELVLGIGSIILIGLILAIYFLIQRIKKNKKRD